MCNHNSKNSKHLPGNHSGSSKQKAPKRMYHGPSAKITDAHHDEEHSTWNRRSFLQALGLAVSYTHLTLPTILLV